MLKHIWHHPRKENCGEDCRNFCCTKIEHFGVTAGDLTIFADVNLHVHCGELTALIGPNGAGKSTLLRAILGEVRHTGQLHYVDAKGKHTGAPIIGYVPQYLRFDVSTPTSVKDIFAACLTSAPVWLFNRRRLAPRIKESLARVKAEHLMERRLGALSGGELQRVLLALALDPLPDLLLLDEPVSGVDQSGLKLFYELVGELRAKEDMAIILISHDLDMVKNYADKVVLLNKKVVAAGTPEVVLQSEATQKLLGLPSIERGQAQ
ncbi:MAG: ATP-binding cassette domain-containing protein [Selenomonadaceae bacterium]|nr:ATP-binding cassette domain-containing protein [Selenomonadaceae bacterium]